MHDPKDTSFLGHPKGLAYLAFTEAFERFSYYGMQALLVLYMVKALFHPGHQEQVLFLAPASRLFGGLEGQALASAIFGAYGALVYLTPIAGGLLADRWLGKRKAVLAGAIIMAIGHFLMASEPAFLLALLFLVIGSGLLKGNIASQVGGLYTEEDLRRADAFQIFYLGINAGVIAAPLIVGTLGEKVGWHWGFAAAGVGMLVSLIIYISGWKYLPVSENAHGERPPITMADWKHATPLLLLIPVLAIAIIPNQQIFNAYLVWGDRDFDLVFAGTRLPTTWLVTLDAIVSVSFLFLVALFWRWWGKTRREPDELEKILIGSVFTVAGVACLYMAAATQPAGGKIGLWWPVSFHILNSIAFAHMLPITLALFARLAPASMNATVIGLYYLAFFAGNALTGKIGTLFETMPTTSFWLLHLALAAGSGLAFWLFRWLAWPRLAHQRPQPA